MADLQTSGFPLQELPPRINLPDTITHFDVGAVYDRAKQALDLSDTMRAASEQAVLGPARMQAGIAQGALGTEQAKAGMRVLPFATQAQIAQQQAAVPEAQLAGETAQAERTAGVPAQSAQSTLAQLSSEEQKALYLAHYNKMRVLGHVPEMAANIANSEMQSLSEAGGFQFIPFGGMTPAEAEGATNGGTQPHQTPTAQPEATLATTPAATSAAAVPAGSGAAQAGAPAAAGSMAMPSQTVPPATTQPVGAGAAPLSRAPAAITPVVNAMASRGTVPGAPMASQVVGSPTGGGTSEGPAMQGGGAPQAPLASQPENPLTVGGMPMGGVIRTLDTATGEIQSHPVELPLAALMKKPLGFSFDPVLGPDGKQLTDQKTGLPMYQKVGQFMGPFGITKAPLGNPEGMANMPVGGTQAVPGANPQLGVADPNQFQLLNGKGSIGLNSTVALPPAKLNNPAQFPLTDTPLQRPWADDVGTHAHDNKRFDQRIELNSKAAQANVSANVGQELKTDQVLQNANLALNANQDFAKALGIDPQTWTALPFGEKLARAFSSNYQLGLNMATTAFATNIPKGLNRVTQIEWSNMIQAGLNPNNNPEVNAKLARNLMPNLSRSQDIVEGYNQYVNNSRDGTDFGWSELVARYLRDNPMTADPGSRLSLSDWSRLVAAKAPNPNSYYQENGMPDQTSLFKAERGESNLPTYGEDGYNGGIGRIGGFPKPASVPVGTKRWVKGIGQIQIIDPTHFRVISVAPAQ